MTSKWCGKCEQEKPIIDFSKDRSRKDGMNRICKTCAYEYRISKHLPVFSQKSTKTDHKICRMCCIEKPHVDFKAKPSAKSGLSTWCRPCEKEYNSIKHMERYKAHPKPKKPTIIPKSPNRPQKELLPDGLKRCTKCKEVKPANLECFHGFKGVKSGLNPVCKICANNKARKYKDEQSEEDKLTAKLKAKESMAARNKADPEKYKKKRGICSRNQYNRKLEKEGKVRTREPRAPRRWFRKPIPTEYKCKKCLIVKPTIEFAHLNGGRRCRNCLPCRLETNRIELEKRAVYQAMLEKSKIPEGFKKCVKCKQIKDLETSFYIKSSTKDGRSPMCCICRDDHVKNRPIPIKKIQKLSMKEGYKFCLKCDQELPVDKFRSHGSKRAPYHLCRKCESKRNSENPERRACNKARSRVQKFLQNKKSKYAGDIGCSPKDLKIHLESQFSRGMKWSNSGEWHIDHYFPLSQAYKFGEIVFKAACHYKNLRPMWAEDNVAKHAYVPKEFEDIEDFLKFIYST